MSQVPLGQSSDRTAPFSAIEQVGARALDTDYINGPGRRLVIVSVSCTATISAQAYAGYRSQVGGISVVEDSVVGLSSGIAETSRHAVWFPVDPGGTYRVTSNVGPGGSLALQQWLEVDL